MKLNLKELNQVTGGRGMTREDILNQTILNLRNEINSLKGKIENLNKGIENALGREKLYTQKLGEVRKENEELKLRIIVLETLLKTKN